MSMIANIERTMERCTAAVWSRIRPARDRPIELVAILHRECDENAMILGHCRTLIPNHFTIELPYDVHHRIAPHAGRLVPELAAQIRRHAAERHYRFAGPVTVRLRVSAECDGLPYRISSRTVCSGEQAHTPELTRSLPLPTAPRPAPATGEDGRPD